MAQSLSMDLRSRLLAAVDDGVSCRGQRRALALRLLGRSAGKRSGARSAALLQSVKVVICARAGLKSAVTTFWRFGRHARISRLKSYARALPRLVCPSLYSDFTASSRVAA
jgi:hypothetical protein